MVTLPSDSNKKIIPASTMRAISIVENNFPELAEENLVRDLMYAFQGLDGRYIRYDPQTDSMRVDPSIGVTRPTRDLVARLGEAGWMVRRLRAFAEKNNKTTQGLVLQSLCSSVLQELTDFYRLVAVLEAQLNQGDGASTLSLRRLAVWIQDPLQRLKTLLILVEGVQTQGLRGGAIASYVEKFMQHGDPGVQQIVQGVLACISRPMFLILQRWICEGVLEDPHGEFFIEEIPKVGVDTLWAEGYVLRHEMRPKFISADLANRILLIGKSINFMRRCCKDTDWAHQSMAVAKDVQGLEYGQDAKLDAVVEEASRASNSRVLFLLMDKYRFLSHCQAIKQYLLLGQGDFIQHLMDLIGSDLAKPASSLYRHNLVGVLESAIRGSNAQYDDAEILGRLDVRLADAGSLPAPSSFASASGWDIFSLDYHVDTPLTTIFTPLVMNTYLTLFRYMWGVKRVEYSLAASWRKHMVASHHLGLGGGLKIGGLRGLLHQCNTSRNEMVHFVHNLQYYIMFEVLESSWGELDAAARRASDLDQLIGAHNRFLESLVRRALLTPEFSNLLSSLQRILSLITRFTHVLDNLYSMVVEEVLAKIEEERQQYQRTLEGKWGVETDGGPSASMRKEVGPEVKAQIHQIHQEYRSLLEQFLHALATFKATTVDVNLKFLAFRLDFNEFYQGSGAGRLSASAASSSSSINNNNRPRP